jgi:hypothetical protein
MIGQAQRNLIMLEHSRITSQLGFSLEHTLLAHASIIVELAAKYYLHT